MYNPEGDLRDNTWKNQIFDSLPGFMVTKPKSNNAKLLNIIANLGNLYKNDLLYLTEDMNVEHAHGWLLTDLAKDYGVIRIDNDDEFLRFEVKFNMWKNHMAANRNDFAIMMAFLLGLNSNNFNVEQTGLKAYKITNIPWNFDSGQNSDLKREMVTSIIQAIAPPEFKLDYVEYIKDVHTTRYRATSVNKMITKQVTPKSMNYFKQFFYKPKRAIYNYHINSTEKDVHEK